LTGSLQHFRKLLRRCRSQNLFQAPEPLCAAAPALPAATPAPPAPAPSIVFDYDFEKFAPEGAYIPMGFKGKDFSDFSSFSLNSGEINHDLLTGYVDLETKINGSYEYQAGTFGLVTDRRVFWVSSQASDIGFGYKFEGEFLLKNFESAYNKNKAVLKGKLTKLKDGQKVAEKEFSFRIESDGC
jgi:hypothetical protein